MTRPAHYRVSPREGLTERQREVLGLMARGYTNGQIAKALGITLDGAKFHVSEILKRLDVTSREEAIAAWREGRQPVARLRGLFGMLTGKAVLASAAAAVGSAAIVVGALAISSSLRSSEPQASTAPDRTNVTVDEVLDSMRVPGRVVYIEMKAKTADGTEQVERGWHSADLQTTRTESEVNGVTTSVTIQAPGRKTIFFPDSNSLADGPIDPSAPGAADGVYTLFLHISALLLADEVSYEGETTIDGEAVVRLNTVDVRTEDEVYEEPVGTTNRASIYLRSDNLLPVRLELSMVRPGEGEYEWTFEAAAAEYLDPSSVPPGLFDPDRLAAEHVDLAESLDIAGRQAFATFWLGPRLETAWYAPDGRGSDHQEVVLVSLPQAPGPAGPGDPTVKLGYGPKDQATTLVDLQQGPVGSFQPIRPEQLHAIEAAGNITEMADDSGYFYAEYMPLGTCDYERAQREASCRSTARFGAVLERDGTLIHIVSAPKHDGPVGRDSNPFSSADAIRELVGLLDPIP